MASNSPSTEDVDVDYVVCMPFGEEASCIPITVKAEATVKALRDKICEDRAFKAHIGSEDVNLYQCGILSMEPKDTRFDRVSEWHCQQPRGVEMEPAHRLKKYFKDGPTPEGQEGQKMIDIVVVIKPAVATSRKRPRSSSQDVGRAVSPRASADVMLGMWTRFWGKPLAEIYTGRPEKVLHEDDSASVPPIEVEDGDLLPGRPFLDELWMGQTYLVRAEYIRIYEFVESFFAETAKDPVSIPPAVVITGQPGIGKTVWISYVLRRRLGEGRPTMVVQGNNYCLFTEYGVENVASNSMFFTKNDYQETPWCLIDSADALNGIPYAMSGRMQMGVNPVYVTSPTVNRWKKLHQSKTRRVAIMNPWTKEEIAVASHEILPARRATQALERFRKFGPSARVCLQYGDKEISDYESDCQTAIDEINDMAELLQAAIIHARRLSSGDTEDGGINRPVFPPLSHKICQIRRPNVDIVSREHVMVPMSDEMSDRCAARLMELSDDAVLRVWELFSKFGDARGMTGSIFECYVHRVFRRRIVIKIQEMFQFRQGKYHASFANYDGHPLLKGALDARSDLQECNVDFRPLRCKPYGEGVIQVQPDVYYQPESGTQVAIDSFFVHDGYLYLIQLTGGSSHAINAKLEAFLENLKGCTPGKQMWRFVFVIPKNAERFSSPDSAITVGTVFTGKISMASADKDETDDE